MKTQHISDMDFDLVVIGAGSAGYAAARTAGAAGLKVAIIEGGKEVGGLCILRGCMPTKALLHASEVLHLSRRAAAWGLQVGEAGFDFAAVMARKDRLIAEFADDRRQQLATGRFKFIRARAQFEDAHTLILDDGNRLRARHFVIATGSRVAAPPLAKLNEVGFITSDDALSLRTLPRSLIVLGGGAVAVELAQFFARFDVAVSLIQRSGHLLRDFDPDSARELERVLVREDIKLHCGTQITDAWAAGGKKVVSFLQQDQPLQAAAEEILLALGREPDTAGLSLDAAGVKTEAGRIIANEFMQTSAPHIYAAGDCTGPYEVVHLAVQQGEIAGHNIARPEARRAMDYRLLMQVVFTEPQIATVGLTEKAATARGVDFIAASYRFDDHGKSLIMEARDGFVKLLADPVSGEILGGCATGPMGGELIHEIVAVMCKRMTVAELAAMPHYHPTLAEIWTYPAEELAGRVAARPPARS